MAKFIPVSFPSSVGKNRPCGLAVACKSKGDYYYLILLKLVVNMSIFLSCTLAFFIYWLKSCASNYLKAHHISGGKSGYYLQSHVEEKCSYHKHQTFFTNSRDTTSLHFLSKCGNRFTNFFFLLVVARCLLSILT